MSNRFTVGENAQRSLRRQLGIAHGFGEISRVTRVREVFSQLGSMVFESTGVNFLQCPRHLLMPANAPRCKDLFIESLPEEGVRETEGQTAANPGALVDNGPLLRLFEGSNDLLFAFIHHPIEDVESE